MDVFYLLNIIFSELNITPRRNDRAAAQTRLTAIVIKKGAIPNTPPIREEIHSELFKMGTKYRPIDGLDTNIDASEQTRATIITGAISPFAYFVDFAYAETMASKATKMSTVEITTRKSPK